MRTYSLRSTLVFIVLLLYLLVLTTACKKNSDKTPADGKFSFTYNGTQYVLPYKEGTPEWGIELGGIFINRPDLFNGYIHFPYTDCAYLQPSYVISIQLGANCQLTGFFGSPIDSVAVYIYQSGSVNILYKNCRNKSEYSLSVFRTISYSVCDIYGMFDLILKNKENKTITITEGKLEAYSVRR